MPETETEAFRAARERVLERIAAAAARAGREPASVTLVAVSKTVPVERLAEAVEAGIDVLGENRVQEAEAKVGALHDVRWHLVGTLQSNKARRAVELFDVVQSLDSLALAARLDRLAGELRPGSRLPVLVQVNVDADPSKAGFEQAEAADALPAILELANVDVRGLMTVGRLAGSADEARATFRSLRSLSERLRTAHPGLGPEISMGMSHDFGIAIEEGATIVRIGQALFGPRPHHH
jgi:pyridoxal phosphate enzyme (YggS family)